MATEKQLAAAPPMPLLGGAGSPQSTRRPVLVNGTGAMVRPTPSNADVKNETQEATGEYQLNFVDTDISVVVSSVIGDGLGASYVIDPQVKGSMTLQAARPLTKEELLPALEAALRVQGAALLEVRGVYNIVLLKDAPRRVPNLRSTPDATRAGFGIEIVPLKYVSVADMEAILRPFAPDGGILEINPSRNLLILAGTSQELATMLDVVQTFDVDWLAGMSFGLFPLEFSEPRTIADELGQVFADAKSPIGTVVRIVPLTRLNSIMVVTHQAEYLAKVESWIKQLDVGASTPGRRVYVYEVQNSKASDLARSLKDILSLGGDTPETAQARSNLGSNLNSGITMNRNAGASGSGLTNATASFGTGSSAAPAAANGLSSPLMSRATSSDSALNASTRDSSGLRIVPNEETNALLVLATPSEFAVIQDALRRLDVQPIQVLIQASLVEVTLTDDLRFGLQWAYESGKGPVVLSDASNGTINQQFPGFSFLYTARADIQGVLNSLESLTDIKVISSPKLLVLNNHEAQLEVGDQVPVATQSAVSTVGENAPIVNSVQMRDTGVILHVTPRVNKSGLVLLDVAQEVSDVVPTTTSSINSPTIQQRKVSSTVAVRDRETIALGGLIREGRTLSRSGFPLLSRVPLVGALFGSTGTTKQRTELVVLITPHVIRSSSEAAQTMQELRSEFRALKKSIPEWPVRLESLPPSKPPGKKAEKDIVGTKVQEAPKSKQQNETTQGPDKR